MNKKVSRICEICGVEFKVKPSTLKYNASRFCSPECSRIGSIGRDHSYCSGENHPNWKGGVQFLPYPFIFNNKLKEKIRVRDDYICQCCGMLDEEHIQIYGYSLVIHHVDYNKENCDESNLITVCIQCNSRANYNREHWNSLFVEKMRSLR